jgi:hypothetical protein
MFPGVSREKTTRFQEFQDERVGEGRKKTKK